MATRSFSIWVPAYALGGTGSPSRGHCTSAYVVEVAWQAGAKHLVLFHHDPSHGDVELDRISLEASLLAEQVGVNDVISATEVLELSLGSGL